MAKPTSSTTTLYVHDINNHIIAETDLSGVTWREYVWLNDLPVAVVDGVNTGAPKLYYVHTDHLGRPARMTAQNQGSVWDVIYAPFGAVSYIWTNPETMDIRFPGQWFQLETGLAYNWHRHYDASLGRYIQPDPLGLDALLSDGPSVYGYVGGNPLAKVDPNGLETYIMNRRLEFFGGKAACGCEPITHTFIFTTNQSGEVSHTYSWGNSANLHGWNLDQALDRIAAMQALLGNSAQLLAPDTFDKFVQLAFEQLNTVENEHLNGMVTYNCKFEATRLWLRAQQLYIDSEIRRKR